MATNLEFIKSASGSSVSSLSVTDCFSDKYDVYEVYISKVFGKQASGNAVLYMRFLDSGGSVISAAEYDWAMLDLKAYAAFTENKATSDTQIERILIYEITGRGDGAKIVIANPYDSASYTFTMWQSSFIIGGTNGFGAKGIGVHKSAEQLSGINFLPSTSTLDLEVSVYGVK